MICVICKQKIIERKERWVRLTDFKMGVTTSEVFYHLECWRDRFNISNSIRKQKMYKQTQQAISKIVKAINPNSEKVYEIKN